MGNAQPFGFHGEGRILCPDCAQRIYGTSLDLYLMAGDLQEITDEDSPLFAQTGLLCDECFRWIFEPGEAQDAWWRDDPDTQEHIRLLAPFASYLESLDVNVINLVEL